MASSELCVCAGTQRPSLPVQSPLTTVVGWLGLGVVVKMRVSRVGVALKGPGKAGQPIHRITVQGQWSGALLESPVVQRLVQYWYRTGALQSIREGPGAQAAAALLQVATGKAPPPAPEVPSAPPSFKDTSELAEEGGESDEGDEGDEEYAGSRGRGPAESPRGRPLIHLLLHCLCPCFRPEDLTIFLQDVQDETPAADTDPRERLQGDGESRRLLFSSRKKAKEKTVLVIQHQPHA
ncbi:hypothetical protein PAPYR_5065 [Paratrimastix pyriformis]|uniref:Uncharacterized protein n=1 Tax=Paratrimastix pyriformis TaxID=342808 RepID=A0ABQ8UIG5_9EUKA|nr:hypothetical protein PAPYR_5065 [Paratrimastix pyriformis]